MSAPAIACSVELYGVARLAAGTRAVPLSLPPDATLRDALTALARERPALVGKVMDETGGRLLEGYALNVNGAEFVADLGVPVREGDAVLVLSAEAGG